MKKFFLPTTIIVLLFAVACNITGNLKVSPGASFLIAQESPIQNNVLLDLYVNGSKFITNIFYTGYTGYSLVAGGPYNFQFNLATTDTALLNSNVSLQSGYSYSFFCIDTFGSAYMQGVLVQDNLNVPSGDSAKIRFMQFSPIGDSAIDSTVQFAIKDSSILSGNRSFNDQNTNPALDSFINIHAGAHTFEVALDSALTNVIYTTVDTLAAGKIYTIVLTGFTSQAGTPQRLRSYLVKHN